MFFNYGYKVSKILNDAEKERYDLSHPYVGSEHLLLSILKNDNNCANIFSKYNIDYDTFKSKLISTVGKCQKKQDINLYTPLLKRIISYATSTAEEEKKEVTSKDLIIALLEEAEGIAFRLLLSLDVDPDSLYHDLRKENSFNNLTINEIGINLNECVDMNEKVIGREEEIMDIIEILLRKKKNNPILVGKAGVGKSAIVEELARRINQKDVPSFLQDKQIISLEMGSLVAGTKYRGEFEERLTKIVNELIHSKNIILFIDEVHTISNAGGSEGAINAADILKPYMARGEIKVIGATTNEEYEKYIIKDKALERRFEKIIIKEPNLKEMQKLMISIKGEYEKYHNIEIDSSTVKYLVNKADLLISNKYNPDKCIELLDTVCSRVRLKHSSSNKMLEKLENLKKISLSLNDYKKAAYYCNKHLRLQKDNKLIKVTKEDVLEVIENKVKLPNKHCIDNLNNLDISSDIKSILLKSLKDKLNNINKINSLLLVGKDNKLILDFLINNYNIHCNPFIIDLKEFDNVNKLVGVSFGYVGYNDKYILKDIINYPYSLVVFKNIDEANNDIKRIINKIINEGIITSGNCEKLDFTKAFIVCTIENKTSNSVGFLNETKIVTDSNYNNVINLEDNKAGVNLT